MYGASSDLFYLGGWVEINIRPANFFEKKSSDRTIAQDRYERAMTAETTIQDSSQTRQIRCWGLLIYMRTSFSARESERKIHSVLRSLWTFLFRITIDVTEMLNCLGVENKWTVIKVEPSSRGSRDNETRWVLS